MRLLPASKLSKPAKWAGADRGAAGSTSQICLGPGLETGSSSLTKNLHSVPNDNLNLHCPFKTGKSFAPFLSTAGGCSCRTVEKVPGREGKEGFRVCGKEGCY